MIARNGLCGSSFAVDAGAILLGDVVRKLTRSGVWSEEQKVKVRKTVDQEENKKSVKHGGGMENISQKGGGGKGVRDGAVQCICSARHCVATGRDRLIARYT